MDSGIALGEPKARAVVPAPVRLEPCREERSGRDGALATMVTGPWNRIAHEAARRFVETRGAWSRTLLVIGGAGMGKSRLLQAIEEGLRESPGRRPDVMRISCDDFLRQFTYAATHNRMVAFRLKFRSTDVLLFDDADKLAHRPATQEEFLHLFDHLDATGRNLVVTTRTRPRDIPGMTRTLQTRLAAAMQVRLDEPDEAGRRGLLQSAALRERRTLTVEVLDAAARSPGSVGDVLGRWTRLREIPVLTAAAAYTAAGASPRSGPGLEDITRRVAAHYGLKLAEICGAGRSRRVTLPRHVCFHLAKKLTPLSLQEIAAFFGGRNHATVLYACRKMAAELMVDLPLRQQVARLERDVLEAK